MNKYMMIAAAVAVLGTGACTSNEPTLGKELRASGAEYQKLGEQWDDGKAMIAKGEKLVKDGNKEIKSGEKKVSKGEKMIRDGRKLVQQTERAVEERRAQ